MKKHVLFAKTLMIMVLTGAFSWGSLSTANAQVSAYSFAQSTGTYTPATGTPFFVNQDDGSSAQSIGFTFNMGGVDFTDMRVNSNGNIRLGTSNPTAQYSPLSTTSNTYAISPFGRDGRSLGGIIVEVQGSAPNRVCVIQYDNYQPQYNGPGESIDMQVRLYETTNVIEFVYSDPVAGASNRTSQVGLRGSNATADFVNRTTTTDWNASTAGGANNATMAFSTSVTLPANGLTFTWTPPSCVAPGGLAASLVSLTEANLSWNAPTPTPGVGYEWAVTTSATPPASGTPVAGLSANDNTLMANTVYYLHVRSECSAGVYSGWATQTFATLEGNDCGSVQDLGLLTSPFSGTTAGGYTNSFTNSCLSGTAGDRIFKIDVPDNHALFIGQSANSYDSRHRIAWGGSCPGTTEINTGYVANFPTLTTTGTIAGCLDDDDLTHYYFNNTTGVTQTVYWTQDAYTTGTGAFTLEWQVIENAPAPGCASNFVVTPTPGCDNYPITLSWDAAATATGYKITVGTTPGGTDVANNVDLGNVLSTVLDEPALNTTYYYTVVPYNTGGDAVGCTEESYTTGGVGCACVPTYSVGKTDGDLISNVEIPGTTLANNSGTAQTNPAFTYFNTLPNHTGDLMVGSTYDVTISIGTWGSQGVRAWIDYNDDGIFDASESIGATTIAPGQGFNASGYPPAIFSVTVSTSAPLGTHRMRIRSSYFTTASTIDPCSEYSFGETEDYDITIVPAPPTVQLNNASCGATNVAMSQLVNSQTSPGALQYRFRITGTNSQSWPSDQFIYTSNSKNFRFQFIPGSMWGETYGVEVAYSTVPGVFGPYGNSCNVTLQSLASQPLSEVNAVVCGTTVSMNDFVNTAFVSGAQAYRFQIVGSNAAGWAADTYEQVTTAPVRKFKFGQIPGALFGETYAVAVAYQDGSGNWSAYGTPCNVTIETPSTQLQVGDCGAVGVTGADELLADNVFGASGYRFRITGANDAGWMMDQITVDRPNRVFWMNLANGWLPGETYTIEVAVQDAAGDYGAYGSACSITMFGTPSLAIVNVDAAAQTKATIEGAFGATASHNPFTRDFALNLVNANDTDAINVAIYDMSGKLIEASSVNPMDIESARFGANLATGMYMIQVTQGTNQAVIRQVKN